MDSRNAHPLGGFGWQGIQRFRSIGKDIQLMEHNLAISKQSLKNRIQHQFIETQREYMARVNQALFQFPTLDDYKESINLLVKLRSPKLSNSLKPTIINELLSESLQPLSEDELLLETEKIEIYKKIIIKYSEENIVIKPHPRETTNYKNIFPKIEIIFENFPSEFLDLYDIKFEKIITLFSTAALNLARGNFKNLIFYGTRVHPKLLEKWGDSDLIMKANAFLEEE